MKRLLMLLATTGALAASVGLSAASALPPGTVSIVGCAFGSGGNAIVPAGTPVSLTVGYADRNRGRVQDFLNAQTTNVTIDGTPVANASSYWGAIDSSNATRWTYATGAPLASGQSMVVTLDILVSHRIPAGKDDNGHPLFEGPGSIFGGPIQCTITGA